MNKSLSETQIEPDGSITQITGPFTLTYITKKKCNVCNSHNDLKLYHSSLELKLYVRFDLIQVLKGIYFM